GRGGGTSIGGQGDRPAGSELGDGRPPVVDPLGEHRRQHVQHDVGGRGGAGGGAQHAADGSVGGGDQLGAELQHPVLVGIGGDDLHALAGGDRLPVLRAGRGHVLQQRLEALL